jgi:hypothetical protein
MAGMSISDAVDGCSTSAQMAWMWVPLTLSSRGRLLQCMSPVMADTVAKVLLHR